MTRTYHAPARVAGAERTRTAILAAARARFEAEGWAATTIGRVASDAGVSHKTVEARFGTKVNLLAEVVASLGPAPADADAARRFKEAPSAIAALPHHAAYAAPLTARSAPIASAIAAAAPLDPRVAELAQRNRRNLDFGARWAAEIVIGKRGLAGGLTVEEAERVFRFAIDPATYRTLTVELGLAADGFEAWMLRYERGMLLLRT